MGRCHGVSCCVPHLEGPCRCWIELCYNCVKTLSALFAGVSFRAKSRCPKLLEINKSERNQERVYDLRAKKSKLECPVSFTLCGP